MVFNSRALALLCGITIGGVTTAFLSLVPEVSGLALLIAGALSFSSGYILFRLVADFVFFKEIDNIHDALKSIQDQDLSFLSRQTKSAWNPLRRINREIHNYAERKQQEIDELKRMELFRREFIADISHELKTPIFAAQGFVHTLLDGAVEDKKVRGKFLKKAAKSLDGLNMLVQDLLTISQMEIGEIKMHYENFDIIELIREVFDQLEDKSEKKSITLKFSGDFKDPAYVLADYQRIYQVMTNLITNAIKYTKNKGYVMVTVKEIEEKVEVSVEDNGRGIPSEDLSRIFERFYRVEKSRSKEKGGTGLGLSIVKHIMEAHNTNIEVSSELKKGSKFWFKLEKGSPTQKPVWEEEEDEEEYAKSTEE